MNNKLIKNQNKHLNYILIKLLMIILKLIKKENYNIIMILYKIIYKKKFINDYLYIIDYNIIYPFHLNYFINLYNRQFNILFIF